MKKFIIVLLSLFASVAVAKKQVYQIKMDVILGLAKPESFGLIVEEGQNGKISAEKNGKTTSIAVVAKESTQGENKGIKLDMVLSTTDEKGKVTVLGKPQFIVIENSPATITVGNKSGVRDYELSVTASRMK